MLYTENQAQTLSRLEANLMGDSSDNRTIPFTIPGDVAETNLGKDYCPRVRDDFQGVIWIQATRLVEDL